MGPDCNWQLVETFEFVGEPRAGGADPQWRSRKVTWNYGEACAREVIVLEETDGDPATPKRRVHRPWTRSCENRGEADLNLVPDPRQEGTCQENIHVMGPRPTLTAPSLGWTGPRPESQMRDGCAYTARSRQIDHRGNVRVVTFSITRSGDPGAVIQVDRRALYEFVPKPGESLTFTATVPSGTARFRFELDRDGTSRFPGYATNANVDDRFLGAHRLGELPGGYANDGPDVIFHPQHFDPAQWSRVEPGAVETREPQAQATVTVTALDYGAVGRLRAYTQSTTCGGTWVPVGIRFGNEAREAIDIPLDNDSNLIADVLDEYAGTSSAADDDDQPKGNGMAGDGLTAFEEYRGFLTAATPCKDTPTIEHIRTNPRRKDLFVHTLDPEFAQALPLFEWSSNLAVHGICEAQYVDNETRIVNFTLQHARMRHWRSQRISSDVPQHGIHLRSAVLREDWPVALTCSDRPCLDDSSIGPPALTYDIRINKSRITSEGSGLARELLHLVVHELGHAVGMPHHNDTSVNWRIVNGRADIRGPLIVAPGGDCQDPALSPNPKIVGAYLDETFVGCYASCLLVLQTGQRSGEAECPMRYSWGTFHEAPGSTARYLGQAKANRSSEGDSGAATPFSFWTGRFNLYDNDNDVRSLGRFCRSQTGSGLNDAARGDRNHAGNAVRVCVDYLVVNDGVLPRGGDR